MEINLKNKQKIQIQVTIGKSILKEYRQNVGIKYYLLECITDVQCNDVIVSGKTMVHTIPASYTGYGKHDDKLIDLCKRHGRDANWRASK